MKSEQLIFHKTYKLGFSYLTFFISQIIAYFWYSPQESENTNCVVNSPQEYYSLHFKQLLYFKYV